MKHIRLEFAHNRSSYLPWILRLCKEFPTFKEFEEGGMRIYSIEVADTDQDLSALEAIHNKVYFWKQVAYFVNGKLVAGGDVFRYIIDRKARRRNLLSRGEVKPFIDSL